MVQVTFDSISKFVLRASVHLTKYAPHAEAEPSDKECHDDKDVDSIGGKPFPIHNPEACTTVSSIEYLLLSLLWVISISSG